MSDLFFRRTGIPKPTREQLARRTPEEQPKAPMVTTSTRGSGSKTIVRTPEEQAQKSYETMKQVEQVKTEQQKEIMMMENVQRNVKPTGQYRVDINGKSVTMSGFAFKPYVLAKIGEMKSNYRQIERAEFQSQKQWQYFSSGSRDWHPKTKVVETSKGIRVDFPYAGAEKYSYYKSKIENPVTGFVLTATGGDPLGIPSAYYTATGQRQKAIDVKIKALHGVKDKPFSTWMGSPYTAIGLSAAGGTAIGSASPYIAGYSAAKLGSTALAVGRGSVYLGTGVLIGSQVHPIVKDIQRGRTGEALGRGVVMGLSFASAYSGYKSVNADTKAKLYDAGFKRGTVGKLKVNVPSTKIYKGVSGEKVGTVGKIKMIKTSGTPKEISKFDVMEMTMWKPQGKQLRIRFPSYAGDKNIVSMVKPQQNLYIDFPGSNYWGSRFKTGGLGLGVSGRGIRGATVTTKGSTPLTKGGGLRYIRGRLVQNNNIFTYKIFKSVGYKQLTIKEAYGFGGISKTVNRLVPGQIFNSGLTPEVVFVSPPVSYFKPTVFMNIGSRRKPVFKTEVSSVSAVGLVNTPKVDVMSRMGSKMSQISVVTPKTSSKLDVGSLSAVKQDYLSSSVSATESIYNKTIQTGRTSYSFGIPYPKGGIYGRGRLTSGFSLFGKKKRFRKVDIPNPFKGGI